MITISKLETKKRKLSIRTALLAGILVVGQGLLLLAPGSSNAQQAYEAYYNYLGNYPHEKETGWHQDAQGLTHDQDNWFITQRKRLWKIPVTQDLNDVDSNDPGVLARELNDTDLDFGE